jgi:hypothetical protein
MRRDTIAELGVPYSVLFRKYKIREDEMGEI